MEITPADWNEIRRVVDAGLGSGLHAAFASVGEDGSPQLTPIGSLLLDEPGHGVYFERTAVGLARDLERDQRVCVMALDARKWEFLRMLWRGKLRRPIGVRLHGTVGERRESTSEEVERFLRHVRPVRFLRGHGLLWSRLRTVRDVRFHAFEPVRLPSLGEAWPVSAG